ncbi:hypothetical protein MPH_06764 [Macrophomina phaseolina MS6]|uniref:Uncharacterized protein n=2 Tax=Macrophomina phaseolina TaxID=35725 RepID=K2SGX6_MACPH|nr:hypothetical protein MPH_06764 [Macrophomina phaseolina MS6]KAH7051176.1 hypothetical protein B0J12DRAFT_699245 [Macrophomina phaseolina]
MPIDWKSQQSYQRLLAALVAASDGNVDYKKVAYFFGQGATYDSIEGRFRIAKKMATTLKAEAEEEGRALPATRSKGAITTPRKPRAKPDQQPTRSGRIQKTPSKRRSTVAAKIKQEPQTPTSLGSDDTQTSDNPQGGIDLDASVNPYDYSFESASLDPRILGFDGEEV